MSPNALKCGVNDLKTNVNDISNSFKGLQDEIQLCTTVIADKVLNATIERTFVNI